MAKGALLIFLGLLALSILGLGLFILVRRLRSPNRAVAKAARPEKRARPNTAAPAPLKPRRESPYRDTAPKTKVKYGEPLMLRLFVEDQNTLIGKRNTHLVKPGLSFTVGGGRSDFLIFLVPLPPHIGELRYESATCSFYPRKPAYFPDIGNNPVPDCVGKTIRIVSDKGYELFMRIEQYEDPLVKLNRLMRSIRIPSAAGETSVE
ncbi:MAG: hypothetical protein LBQ46_08145 [Treponema sp.]|jgi:hypothetical protein|nr:hypothetical protein [Treponema sp.]